MYSLWRGTDRIVLIVLSEIAREERNSLWHLFSAVPEAVRLGAEHYRRHMPDMSGVVNKLFKRYEIEGIAMPYTIEDFRREYLSELSPEERLSGLSPEEFLRGLSPDTIEELKACLEKLRPSKTPKRTRSAKPRAVDPRKRRK